MWGYKWSIGVGWHRAFKKSSCDYVKHTKKDIISIIAGVKCV